MVAFDRWSMQSKSFVVFVDRVLALQSNFTLEKFSIKTIDLDDLVNPEFVIRWIHNVLARGVLDFRLATISWGFYFQLPWNFFMSETLVRLRIEIVGQPATIYGEDFHLPKLKTLYLESVMFENAETGFSKLLAGCKVLEELALERSDAYMWESFSVYVTTLKRLTFCAHNKAVQSPSSVSFDTPNLVSLEYTEVNARKYPKVNFDSLVEAKIDLWMTRKQYQMARSIAKASGSEIEALSSEVNNLFSDCTDFIKGICNVKSLYLSGSTLEVLTFCCKEIPIFRNLTHLAITNMRKFGWESLPRLLKSCSNLETLAFRGLFHRCSDVCFCKSRKEDDHTCLSTSPVKVVKILIYGQIDTHLEEMNQFLETMPNLEQLVLYYHSLFDQNVVQVSTQLQRVASPKCKVQIIHSDLFVLPEWGRYY